MIHYRLLKGLNPVTMTSTDEALTKGKKDERGLKIRAYQAGSGETFQVLDQ
jgi:hypothetical protein